ncbi:unnamed protein product [Malus baccata var. baccata]
MAVNNCTCASSPPLLSSKSHHSNPPRFHPHPNFPKFDRCSFPTVSWRQNIGSLSTSDSRLVRASASASDSGSDSESREPMLPPYNVLITGSTKGYALAKEFLKAGDNVVICSRSAERVNAAVQSLRQDFGEQHVWGTNCDVREGQDVKDLVAFAQKNLKYIDIWINNAGSNAYSYKPLAEASDEDLIEVVTTNTLGLMLCCREAIKMMFNQPRGGHIFNIDGAGSDGRPTPRFAAYGATKRSVVHLTKSLQAELQMQDVKNVAVHNLSYLTVVLKEHKRNETICEVNGDDALDLGSQALFQKRRRYLMNWVPSFFSPPKTSRLICRGLHASKHFSPPNSDNIVFKAVCVNLRQRRWKLLEQISHCLTSSLVSRVVREFRNSPQLALEFYNWVRRNRNRNFPQFLESSCTVIHVLIDSRRYDDALYVMESLMGADGLPALVVLEGLSNSCGEGCGCSSPAVFDAFVRACTRFGDSDGAYEVIKKLRLDGYWVSIHAWNNFLNHVIKLNDIDRFWKMYKEMLSYGYVENVNTFNLVIYALCKECKLLEAMSAYYRMLKSGVWPSVVTFNMIIDGACRMGDMELALKVLRKMGVMSEDCVTPNSVTYNCIINGFCKIGGLSVAEEICAEMTEVGVPVNLRTYATLVDGYAKRGSLEVALRLCDEMVERGLTPNPVVYNSIIHRLCIEGDIEEAFSLLSDMIERNICPDQFTYSILIKGLSRNGLATEAIRFLRHILEKNLVKDVFSHNILIDYLCKSKNLRAAKQLMGSMFVRGLLPDTITYGTLIDCHFKEGNIGNAVQIYEKLIVGKEKPNLVIYNSVINGLCKEASVDIAKLLMDSLQRMDVLDIITYNTMINGYFISGMIDQAFVLLWEMEKAGISLNVVTYNILINFLCKFGCIQQAKELMKVMISRGVIPDFITYTTLITNLSKNCSPEEVIALHDYMVIEGVIPDRQTYKDIVCPCLPEENSKISTVG